MRNSCERYSRRTRRYRQYAGELPILIMDSTHCAVPELCQNSIHFESQELPFEREQLPQVVEIRHIGMERVEGLEPANILRNQQVAGSIPAGGSTSSSFNFSP